MQYGRLTEPAGPPERTKGYTSGLDVTMTIAAKNSHIAKNDDFSTDNLFSGC